LVGLRRWRGSRARGKKYDESLGSFLFTVRNPHNTGERRFPIKEAEKGSAIDCDAQWGPRFGSEMCVADMCNENNRSSTYCFGETYRNDTGIDGKTLFPVKETEVFEVLE
jgi:hypothetical protein